MIDLGPRTNKGVAIFKLLHQHEPQPLLDDPYIELFLSPTQIDLVSKLPPMPCERPADDEQCLIWSAYWYTILRERVIDDILVDALDRGCTQVVSFGSGYEIRFLRLLRDQKPPVRAFELDLPETIREKQECLSRSDFGVPDGMELIPFDLRTNRYESLQSFGYKPEAPTVFVIQGVSYYLDEAVFERLLYFASTNARTCSSIVYDGCHPEMTFINDRVPGIRTQVEKLQTIGEPYVFAERPAQALQRLQRYAWIDTECLDAMDLEERYLDRRSLPEFMWYVVHGKRGVAS